MVTWWCIGQGVGLQLERPRDQLSSVPLSGNDLGQVVHTRASVTKQYNLVLIAGQLCPATGKVTVGLASHWPCVTDLEWFIDLQAQGLSKGGEHLTTLLISISVEPRLAIIAVF